MCCQRQDGSESGRDERQRCKVREEQRRVQILGEIKGIVREVQTGDIGKNGRISEAGHGEGREVGGRQVETDAFEIRPWVFVEILPSW